MKQTNLKEIKTTEEDIDKGLMQNRSLDTEIDEVLSGYNRAVAEGMVAFIVPLLTRLDALRASKYTNLQHIDSAVDKVRELYSTLRGLGAQLRELE